MIQTRQFPFYIKLACVLLILVFTGFIAQYLQTLLVPLILGTFFAILLCPVSNIFENKLRFPRSVASIVPVILFVLCIATLLFFLGRSIGSLSADLPEFKKQLLLSFHEVQVWVKNRFGIKYDDQMNYLSESASKSLSAGTSLIGQTLLSLSSVAIMLTFTCIYTFFLLFYRAHIILFIKKLFDEKHHNNVVTVVFELKYVVKKYLIGLLLQMSIVAGLGFVAFSIIGIKYNLLLAIILGIFNVIPYIGIAIALLLTLLITLATGSASQLLLVSIAIVLIHVVDSNYVLPKVVGSKVKINSLIAMLGLVLGEMLWGISGMFLSIPILAIMKIVFDHVQELKPWAYLIGEEETPEEEEQEVVRIEQGEEIPAAT